MSFKSLSSKKNYLIIPIVAMAAIGCILLAYGNLLHVSFVYDDWHWLRRVLDDSPLSYFLKIVDFRQPQYFYRPVPRLFFYLEYLLFGKNPGGWHLISLLVHGANSTLWGLLLFALTGRRGMAFLAAVAFAVFPNISGAVFWISDVEMLLGVFFGVLCLLWWTRFLITGSVAIFLGALGCFALSLLSKESMVLLCPFMAILHWGLLHSHRLAYKVRCWPYVALVLVLIGYLAADVYVLQQYVRIVGAVYTPGGHALVNLAYYISLLITPLQSWSVHTPADFVLRLGGFGILAIVLWRKVGWSVGFLLLFPAVGFLPYIWWQGVASRYSYLAALGSTGLAALALSVFWNWRGRLWPVTRSLCAIVFVLLLVLQIKDVQVGEAQWAELTRSQEKVLHDVESLNPTIPPGSSLYFLNSPTRADYTVQMMNVQVDKSLRASTVDLGMLPYPEPGAPIYVYYYLDSTLNRLSYSNAMARPQASRPLPLRFGPVISLTGYDVPSATLERGQPFLLLLYWGADGPADRNYSVFVHLVDRSGTVLAQADNWPQAGRAPTSGWKKGQFIGDYYLIPISESITSGDAWIEVGLYDLATMQRIPVSDEYGNIVDHRLVIGPITVR